jgi:type IV secretory pathway protease TraF
MKAPRKQRVKRFGPWRLGAFGGLAFLWTVCQAALRINGTHSEPVGIYWAISEAPSKGDFVFALPPAEPIFIVFAYACDRYKVLVRFSPAS